MFFVFGVFCYADLSLAAPSISGIYGTISNGSQITISGSGFGNDGPNIIIFDDFEKGTNGNIISILPNSAQVNQ